jgi:hypothetical protein
MGSQIAAQLARKPANVRPRQNAAKPACNGIASDPKKYFVLNMFMFNTGTSLQINCIVQYIPKVFVVNTKSYTVTLLADSIMNALNITFLLAVFCLSIKVFRSYFVGG